VAVRHTIDSLSRQRLYACTPSQSAVQNLDCKSKRFRGRKLLQKRYTRKKPCKIKTYIYIYMRAVLKVRGLSLLLRVGTLWKCGDGLFFEVPPLASDALLTTLYPLLKNVLQTVDHFEISCLGAPFSWLEKPRNRMGRDLDCMANVLMGVPRSAFSKPKTKFNSDLVSCSFGAFPTMKREIRSKKFRSDQQSAARFREVGGAL
jgi:hypothetical protein